MSGFERKSSSIKNRGAITWLRYTYCLLYYNILRCYTRNPESGMDLRIDKLNYNTA